MYEAALETASIGRVDLLSLCVSEAECSVPLDDMESDAATVTLQWCGRALYKVLELSVLVPRP